MTTEEKTTYLTEAFYRLRNEGRCSTKKEFAEILGMHPGSLSAAMNGNAAYLTDSLISKVQALAPTEAQQPQQRGIFVPKETVDMFRDLAATVRSQQETIAALTGVHEKKEDASIPAILRR